MGRIDNKVAVITGAASGMGRATAIRFAGEGGAVVVADLNEDGGAATVRECKESGGRAVFHRTDVAAETGVKTLIARALSEFGRLDITFNNAGFVGALGPLEEISAESWDSTHAVLLRGVFFGIRPDTTAADLTGAVLEGVALAFAVQSVVAVFAGSLIAFLPHQVVRVGAGLRFIAMAALKP